MAPPSRGTAPLRPELPDGAEAVLPSPEGGTTAPGQSTKTNKPDKQETWKSSAEIRSM